MYNFTMTSWSFVTHHCKNKIVNLQLNLSFRHKVLYIDTYMITSRRIFRFASSGITIRHKDHHLVPNKIAHYMVYVTTISIWVEFRYDVMNTVTFRTIVNLHFACLCALHLSQCYNCMTVHTVHCLVLRAVWGLT